MFRKSKKTLFIHNMVFTAICISSIVPWYNDKF